MEAADAPGSIFVSHPSFASICGSGPLNGSLLPLASLLLVTTLSTAPFLLASREVERIVVLLVSMSPSFHFNASRLLGWARLNCKCAARGWRGPDNTMRFIANIANVENAFTSSQ